MGKVKKRNGFKVGKRKDLLLDLDSIGFVKYQ